MSKEDFSKCVCCGNAEHRKADVAREEVKKHLVPSIPSVVQPNGDHRIVICAPCDHLVFEGAIIKEIKYRKLLSKAARNAL